MRVAVVSLDTRGGVQPYMALALGLQRAGHEVRFIAASGYGPMLRGRGLTHHALTGNVEDTLRGSAGVTEKGTLASMRFVQQETPRRVVQWAREALEACEGVDVITGGVGGMIAGLAVAERLGVPFLETHLQPVGASTGAFPGTLFPGVPRWLGRAGRRSSHSLSELALWLPFRGAMKKAREALGLNGPARRVGVPPVLYGFSRHVLPEAPEWLGRRFVTGYWFLPAAEDWLPPPGLEAFLGQTGPVVCIGFGSMTTVDSRATTALVEEAVRRAGVRAVLLSGWGAFEAAAHDRIFAAAAVPHDWLYPRVAAVAHHGGAGTTGASLRAGVPTIVVPFTMDQPFWGARVVALGVGPDPIPRRRLTAENLAAALSRAVSDGAMRARAAEMGALIRQEDGVADAVAHFTRLAAGES